MNIWKVKPARRKRLIHQCILYVYRLENLHVAICTQNSYLLRYASLILVYVKKELVFEKKKEGKLLRIHTYKIQKEKSVFREPVFLVH